MQELERPDSKEKETKKGTLLITGGSSGIGTGIIQHLEGKYSRIANFDVAANNTNDVRNPEIILEYTRKFLTPGGFQNDLVVCAGVFRPIDFLRQTTEDIDFVVDINLKGALYTVQAFLKWHEEQNYQIPPNVVLISSISAFHHGGRTNVVYDATKAGISYLVRNLANFNCIVNAIEPGTIRGTKIGSWTPSFGVDEEAKQLVDQGQLGDVEMLGKEVIGKDIAKMVEFLLFENENGAINGATITVDGGLTALRKRF